MLTEHKMHQNIVSKYTKAIMLKENMIFNFLNEIDNNDIDEFWVLCYEPLNHFQCELKKNNDEEFVIKDQANFKLIKTILYEKKF